MLLGELLHAAGLVDPFSGDGMFEGFLSGKLVAEAILAEDLASYPSAVDRGLHALHSAGWGARTAFTRFPRATYGVVLIPVTQRVIEKMLRGELTHPGAARGFERGAVRAIARIAKAAAS